MSETVWITGASSGLGAAMARAWGQRGASVILSGRNTAALETVAADVGDALVLPFETTDLAALPDIVARAETWRGRIDVLVNNAGISQRSLAKDTDFEVYRRIMEVDFFAPVRLTQLVLPAMLARGQGHFVNISSVAGKMGSVLRTAYCAAKHALIGYSDALRGETEHTGIRVTVVTPGFVRTDVARNALAGDGSVRGFSDTDIDTAMSPEDAVAEMLAAIDAGKREVPIVRGGVADMLALRASDPERLFDAMAGFGKALAVRPAAAP